MKGILCTVAAGCMLMAGTVASAGSEDWSVARQWNEELLQAIRINLPRPPVHARNLYHTSLAMYDAWAAYDDVAVQVIHKEKAFAKDIEEARDEAVSFAAYRLLKSRFATGPGSGPTQIALDARMDALGYDSSFTSTEGGSPAALGNRIFASIHAYGMVDGGNQAGNFAPNNGYAPVNAPLPIPEPDDENVVIPIILNNPSRWQPLMFDLLIKQNGIIIGAATQSFVCPHWFGAKSFALKHQHIQDGSYFNPGPPPQFGGATHQEYVDTFLEVVRKSALLDPDDGIMMDCSPASTGNNPLGSYDGTGYKLNPVTGLPYTPQLVKQADYGRCLAEFWADGPHSETPPGHWNVLANYVSDIPNFEHRIGGTGPIVDRLEWDVKLYLALNGATHDAAIGAWSLKGIYDFIRPISAIRYLASLGQSSDPKLPSYHPHGLPLIDGLVSLITEETIQPGGIHEDIPEWMIEIESGFPIWVDHVGEIALMSWRGIPADPETHSGVGWVVGIEWTTYQLPTFVTPPFAGYTSGHSTFSRSAAEVMALFTGSEWFPYGLGEHVIPAGDLDFEYGPTTEIRLQWASYYDAADEAGVSRIWGGIHPPVDDLPARVMGAQIGINAFNQAMQCFNGVACPVDIVGTDEVVDVDDLLYMLQKWGACIGGQPCFADLAATGAVDVDDLLALLQAWGPCPK